MPFRMRSRSIAAGILLLVFSISASATTWVDVEVTCPVCGTMNLFQVPASYGTYVYHGPSKFQYVFWPSTTDRFLYTCKRCHLTAYMGDFESIPAGEVPEIREMLEREARIEGEVIPYYDIPMTVRLPIAENVYEILGRDERFWCEFRRIEGFHLEAAGLMAEAREARKSALALAEGMLEEPSPTRKETLVIAAAMRLLTGDAGGAENALLEASRLRFESPELGKESSEGLDSFLDGLIASFRSEQLGK